MPGLVSIVPFEILRHCTTFLPLRDFASLARCSNRCHDVVDEDWTWTLMLRRDLAGRFDGALADHSDRRVKDVYQMVYTGKYVERRFEDRPAAQKVLIVAGSVVLSPVLLIYLSPKIAAGIYRNAVVPTIASLKALEASSSPASPSDSAAARPRRVTLSLEAEMALARQRDSLPVDESEIAFGDRPFWQRCVIVLISLLISPYLIFKARKLIARYLALLVYKFIWRPFTTAVRWVRNEIRRGVRYVVRFIVNVGRQVMIVARYLRRKTEPSVLAFVAKVRSIAESAYSSSARGGSAFLEGLVRAEDRIVSAVEDFHALVVRTYRRYHTGNFKKRLIAFKNGVIAYAQLTALKIRLVARAVARAVHDYVWQPLVASYRATKRGIQAVGRRLRDAAVYVKDAIRDHLVIPVVNIIKLTILKVKRAVAITSNFVYQNVLAPVGRSIRRGVMATIRAIRLMGSFTFSNVLTPFGRMVRRAALAIARAVRLTGTFLYTRVLAPVGRAALRASVATARAFQITGSFAYNRVCVPVGNAVSGVVVGGGRAAGRAAMWLHSSIVRPTVICMRNAAIALSRAVARLFAVLGDFFFRWVVRPTGVALRSGGQILVQTAKAARDQMIRPTLSAVAALIRAAGRAVQSLMRAVGRQLRLTALAIGSFLRALRAAILEFFKSIARKLGLGK